MMIQKSALYLFICHVTSPLSVGLLLLPCTIMNILSLFRRCCAWRRVRVSYYWTRYYCCPGWTTSTTENCNVGKKIDRQKREVWVVEVTSNNIAAISWLYALLGVRHQSTQREPPVLTPEYPERTTGIPKDRRWLTIT